MIRLSNVLMFCFVVFITTPLESAGLSYDDNFVVFADTQELSNMIIKQSEVHRQILSRRLLNADLNTGEGRTTIHFKLSPDEEKGSVWCATNPKNRNHIIWLIGDTNNIDYLLKHQLTFTVLNTQYEKKEIPAWIQEGLASQHDNGTLKKKRIQTIQGFLKNNEFPDFSKVLNLNTYNCEDPEICAMSNIVIEYLLNLKSDYQKLVSFGLDINSTNIDNALLSHYKISNVQSLVQSTIQYMRDKYSAIK